MSNDTEPTPWEVSVTDGPYVVSGGVPLSRRRPLRSERDEPLTWKTTAELDAGDSYALCRCGGSSNKPFCDGTHANNLFDGTAQADTTPYQEKAKTYEGTGVTVSDDRALCEHAGFCGNRVTNVWKMTKDTDDTRVRSEMIAMVERCPSGALTYAVDGEVVEPDLRPAIGVIDDGPLAVTGGPTGAVTVVRQDGTRDRRARMTLCRCGASRNKPFCDGSHTEAGFSDNGA